MTAEMGVVNGAWALVLVALGFRHITRPNFKPRYENALDGLNSVRRELKDEKTARGASEQKCSECFLNQAALRKEVGRLEQELSGLDSAYDTQFAERGRVEELLATEKRSNAALRGQITRLTMKKPKAKKAVAA